jgi:nucleoside-diphosphate-sugar epimerase
VTTYLVLGASGFLGSHVHEALGQCDESPDLVAVSRRPPHIALSPGSSWVPVDLVTAPVAELVALIEASRPDALINCAGRTSGSAEQMWELNTTFVDKLVQALRLSGPRPFVHLGSAAEYGAQPRDVSIRETAPTHPVSDYGRSKLAATRIITNAAERGDICATVLRVFNPVGPRAPADSLAGRAVRELKMAQEAKRSSVTMGPLSAYRDFVAASDVASAALRATKLGDGDSVINVGRGTGMSCRSMVELLADVAGFEGDVRETAVGSDRSGEVPWQQADVSRLGRDFGWLPATPIAHALEELWRSETAQVFSRRGVANGLRSQ